jgi:diguanylate cyclase (GGDEF)-like protein
MRVAARNDSILLGALTCALVVVFSRPLSMLLDYARDVEANQGLRLLPALVILAGVFVFHQIRKRDEVRAEALAAAASAREATEKAAEMERLVMFGQALARSLDDESIRAAAGAHIPLLAPARGAWAMVHTGGHWQPLTTVGDSSHAERERAARRALGEADPPVGNVRADVCFPMIFGGRPLGVLGVSPDPPLTDHQRSVLAAAASLLAVSLKNAELFREVRDNSMRDALTGCFNRAHALEMLDAELRRARRSHLPMAVIMFDLDRFKQINDRYGHMCGDVVLSAVGQCMRDELRGSDVKCRYGGEEFLIILPDTPVVPGAQRVAETLRRVIETHAVTWNGEPITVTASFGVAAVRPGELDPLAVLARADAAMYCAKSDGRNCVRTADDTAWLVAAGAADPTARPAGAALVSAPVIAGVGPGPRPAA